MRPMDTACGGHEVPASAPTGRTARVTSLILSLLLHLALVLVWVGFPASAPDRHEDPAMAVDLVPSPPETEEKRASAPSSSSPSEPARAIPQLAPGALAEQSSQPSPPQPQAEAAPVPKAPVVEKPKKAPPVTQNERDWVLSRVLRHWRPPNDLAAYDKAELQVQVTIEADGYFAQPYDARQPWNPGEVFDGYASLPPSSIQRRTIDAFYRAIRAAQPLSLPSALKEKTPFRIRLDFRVRDVSR